MNLHPIRRAQILDGNWEINPYGRIFQRAWFSFVDDYPQQGMVVRCWDKAASKAERGKDPDWTAGVKMTKVDGVFYVIDVVRFRETVTSVRGSTEPSPLSTNGTGANSALDKEIGFPELSLTSSSVVSNSISN